MRLFAQTHDFSESAEGRHRADVTCTSMVSLFEWLNGPCMVTLHGHTAWSLHGHTA